MMKTKWLTLGLALILTFSFTAPAALAAEKDLTTRYRVYQNSNLLQEFVTRTEAVNYAGKYANSYVEEIGTRAWLWSQFPTFEVSQYGIAIKTLFTMEDAIKEAKRWDHSSIRNIETGGWVWNNYPKYRVYQGEVSLKNWEFSTLEEAKLEAKRWANSNIIDLESNRWVWDNMSAETKATYRERAKVYKVYQNQFTKDEWEFAYLEDAIKEALRWENSHIVNTSKNGIKVYSNENQYTVYQYQTKLKSFKGLEAAIAYAGLWDHARITLGTRDIWTNYPYYTVYQHSKFIKDFKQLSQALEYGNSIPKAVIYNTRGTTIWDNSQGLQFWAWNGSASDENIKKVVSQTRGMDVNSPTWFELKDASGNIVDKSSEDLTRWLHGQNIEVHPLVHNQFDAALTSSFLSSDEARGKFISTIVNRTAEIGADGINLDFEGMKGSDRDAFTKFVTEFAAAAHAKKLEFSIDLPRGSVKWNHLTAFDHTAIAKVVDYVIIMTYDQHYSGSTEPGAVAGLSWTEGGIKEFLSYGIPRDKLIMGVPFYIRQWKLDASGKLVGNHAIYSHSVRDILINYKVTKTWDERFGQYRMEYVKDGLTHIFWLEDADSVKARLAIAREYSLAGAAAWRLGQEDSSFWNSIASEK
jgi:spore germination protein YaaH